ncbi:hypothetical protein [Streptomyces sp. DSM 15324]|uniref:hypothetical protein n=1 Tax=Streptomyces sp. DSM 15324 TaxID=1739111 RepID=UPI00074A52CB|nr:hypothetical protein [Streptomyces sp. DSM 15324]KUO12065.1 hypothetical protein AQJ58_13090 [Streptomyces sp. DSM 15324]
MPADEPQTTDARPPRLFTLAGVSMRELLTSCAAAEAVSTPPRLPDPTTTGKPAAHPRAA